MSRTRATSSDHGSNGAHGQGIPAFRITSADTCVRVIISWRPIIGCPGQTENGEEWWQFATSPNGARDIANGLRLILASGNLCTSLDVVLPALGFRKR